MKRIIHWMRNRLLGDCARRHDLENLYRQIEGLLSIQSVMSGNPAVKPLRGWALSPDAIAIILGELRDHASPLMMEFGSGQSTIVFGMFFKSQRAGRLVTIEHDADYADKLRSQLDRYELGEVVDVRTVPLTTHEFNGLEKVESCASYDLSGLPNETINLALVDGPIWHNGKFTRFVPLKWSIEHLSPGGKIYLDDANREYEKDVIRLATRNYPVLAHTLLPVEKGLSVLYFPKGESPMPVALDTAN